MLGTRANQETSCRTYQYRNGRNHIHSKRMVEMSPEVLEHLRNVAGTGN